MELTNRKCKMMIFARNSAKGGGGGYIVNIHTRDQILKKKKISLKS